MNKNEKRDRLIKMFKEHKPHGFEIIEGDSRYVVLPSIQKPWYSSYAFYKQKDGSWRSGILKGHFITEENAYNGFVDHFKDYSFEQVQEQLDTQNLSLGEFLNSLK